MTSNANMPIPNHVVALDFGDVSGKLAMRSALIYLTPKVDWILHEFEILWQHLWIISN